MYFHGQGGFQQTFSLCFTSSKSPSCAEERLLLEQQPLPFAPPHLPPDELVPGAVDQAAHLQLVGVEVEEAGGEEVDASLTDPQQRAHKVIFGFHL